MAKRTECNDRFYDSKLYINYDVNTIDCNDSLGYFLRFCASSMFRASHNRTKSFITC